MFSMCRPSSKTSPAFARYFATDWLMRPGGRVDEAEAVVAVRHFHAVDDEVAELPLEDARVVDRRRDR